MPDTNIQLRREIHYSGRVQGVGFRYTVLQIASKREVTGFVRNLPDGRVQLVAEGTSNELAILMREIQSTMKNYIRNVQQQEFPATGEFRGFDIRF